MKISTKGRYALRMLVDLAGHSEGSFVALKDIASRQNISKKYLEQIVPLLNNSGLLRTNRGYQGGYMLSKEPKDYTVGEILRITEGDLFPVDCMKNDPNLCQNAERCPTLFVWEGLYKAITGYLDGVTLQDILDRCSGGSDWDDYCI